MKEKYVYELINDEKKCIPIHIENAVMIIFNLDCRKEKNENPTVLYLVEVI